MSNDLYRARQVLIWLAIATHALIYGLAFAIGMRLNYQTLLPFIAWLGGTLIFAGVYCRWRNMPKLHNIVEPALVGSLLSIAILVSTYLAMLPSLPLADAKLAHLDAAIGFDWRAFVRVVDGLPWLAAFLNLAYQSFTIQLFLIPVLLSVMGQAQRAYWMISSYALVGLCAAIVAVWFPAVGAFPHNHMGPEDLENINIFYGYFFLEQFHGVRGNPNFVFDINDAAGIITFPSVHAVVAALCAWAAWNVRPIRYPVLLLNVGMAVSAVSHGSHYLVDALAGVPLAFLCIALASGLTHLVPERRPKAEPVFATGQATTV